MSISELDGRVMPFKQQLKRETKNRYVSLLDMGALVNAQAANTATLYRQHHGRAMRRLLGSSWRMGWMLMRWEVITVTR